VSPFTTDGFAADTSADLPAADALRRDTVVASDSGVTGDAGNEPDSQPEPHVQVTCSVIGPGLVDRPITFTAYAEFDPPQPLNYNWDVESRPPGSIAVPAPTNELNTVLTPDLPGRWTLVFRVVGQFSGTGSCPATLEVFR
jgi:hypothetical protein